MQIIPFLTGEPLHMAFGRAAGTLLQRLAAGRACDLGGGGALGSGTLSGAARCCCGDAPSSSGGRRGVSAASAARPTTPGAPRHRAHLWHPQQPHQQHQQQQQRRGMAAAPGGAAAPDATTKTVATQPQPGAQRAATDEDWTEVVDEQTGARQGQGRLAGGAWQVAARQRQAQLACAAAMRASSTPPTPPASPPAPRPADAPALAPPRQTPPSHRPDLLLERVHGGDDRAGRAAPAHAFPGQLLPRVRTPPSRPRAPPCSDAPLPPRPCRQPLPALAAAARRVRRCWRATSAARLQRPHRRHPDHLRRPAHSPTATPPPSPRHAPPRCRSGDARFQDGWREPPDADRTYTYSFIGALVGVTAGWATQYFH